MSLSHGYDLWNWMFFWLTSCFLGQETGKSSEFCFGCSFLHPLLGMLFGSYFGWSRSTRILSHINWWLLRLWCHSWMSLINTCCCMVFWEWWTRTGSGMEQVGFVLVFKTVLLDWKNIDRVFLSSVVGVACAYKAVVLHNTKPWFSRSDKPNAWQLMFSLWILLGIINPVDF